MLLVAGVAALAVAALLLPLDAVPEAVARLGPAAPVAGVLVGAALLVALVPRTPVSVACGLLFGATLGPICALFVMVVAATVTFVAGRLLGREFLMRWAQRLAGHRIGRAWTSLDRWVAREGLLAVAAVRSLPLAPYGLVGYAYGASAVRVRDYAVGSVLAGSPSAVTYALLGAAVGGLGGGATPLTIVPMLVGTALTGVVVTRTVLRLRATRRRRLQDDADHPAGDDDDLLRGPTVQRPGHLGQSG
jgi:uncharacterized membrane protein YdjX (TVP38/TMEM64 family)